MDMYRGLWSSHIPFLISILCHQCQSTSSSNILVIGRGRREGGGDGWSALNTIGGIVFLTIAVFEGLSLVTPNQHSLEKPSACNVGIVAGKKLVVFEVVSFNFFLFSSVVVEGLKLAINLLNREDVDEVCGYEDYQRENETRMSSNHYLVFECMEHDLSGLATVQGVKFTEPQVNPQDIVMILICCFNDS
ncbi:hypothetical protein ACSBR2_026355 [Camellia fascicularis]